MLKFPISFIMVKIWISLIKKLNYSNSGLLFVENLGIVHYKNKIYHSPKSTFENPNSEIGSV